MNRGIHGIFRYFIANTEFECVKIRGTDEIVGDSDMENKRKAVIGKGCVEDCKCVIF